MLRHPWRLEHDVLALEQGARTWDAVVVDVGRAAEQIVQAARHALDHGWDAASAESYDAHRRQLVDALDRFTVAAADVSGCLRAVATVLGTAQERLDRSWATIATLPHDLVGQDRVPVFWTDGDEDRERVTRETARAEAVRAELEQLLEQEGERLGAARLELELVRADVDLLAGGQWPGSPYVPEPEGGAPVDGGADHGLGVAGSADVGRPAGAVPPPGVASVAGVPGLTGIDLDSLGLGATSVGAGLAATSAAASLAAARASRRRRESVERGAAGLVGGAPMAAAVRGGTLGRGGPTGAGPPGRSFPRGAGAVPVEASAKGAPRDGSRESTRDSIREAKDAAKEAAKEAKRAEIAERQAQREARRAQRQQAAAAAEAGDPEAR